VVDDGSTDRTVECAEACGNSHIQILHSAGPRGAGGARNTGVTSAKSEWIAFLDADDWWEPNKMELQLRPLTQERTPSVSATSYYLHRGSVSVPVSVGCDRCIPDIGAHVFCDLGAYHTSTLVVPRELLARTMYASHLPRHQDWSLLLALNEVGAKFCRLDRLLSHRSCGRRRSAKADLSLTFAEKTNMSLEASIGFNINILFLKACQERDGRTAYRAAASALRQSRKMGTRSLAIWWRIARANVEKRIFRDLMARAPFTALRGSKYFPFRDQVPGSQSGLRGP
jgi:glycosyltransferase involved in cell wall biosynthesis